MAKKGTVTKGELREEDERPIRWRRYQYIFLIVCEDGKTEPYYFEKLAAKIPEETIYLKAVGTGCSSVGVVERAITERGALKSISRKDVDETWAVFDKDDAEKYVGNSERFSQAFELARKENIKVAYSNEVFELWLLLHFIQVDSKIALPRKEIYRLLEDRIRNNPYYESFVYEHGKKGVLDVIEKVGNADKAISRAEELWEAQKEKTRIEANPSTAVFILVRRINELVDYYSYIPK